MTVSEGIYNSINTATFAYPRRAQRLLRHPASRRRHRPPLRRRQRHEHGPSTLGNIFGSLNVRPRDDGRRLRHVRRGRHVLRADRDRRRHGPRGQERSERRHPRAGPDTIKPEVAEASTMCSRMSSPRARACSSAEARHPDAAKTGTNQYNNQTWVLGTRKAWQRRPSSETPSTVVPPGSDATSRSTANSIHWSTGPISPDHSGGYMQQVVGLYDHGDFDPRPRT